MKIVEEFFRGAKSFWLGLAWFFENPWYLLILMLPLILALIGFAVGIYLVFTYGFESVSWLVPEVGQNTDYVVLLGMLQVIFYLVGLFFCFMLYLVLVNIISSPVYEIISIAVEQDLTQQELPALSWSQAWRVMREEMKKFLFIVAVSLMVAFLPGLNLLAGLLFAIGIGWNFYDYPLLRRAWSFKRRLRFMAQDFWALLGFSIWFLIPFVGWIFVPFAVAGGTMLSLGSLERE